MDCMNGLYLKYTTNSIIDSNTYNKLTETKVLRLADENINIHNSNNICSGFQESLVLNGSYNFTHFTSQTNNGGLIGFDINGSRVLTLDNRATVRELKANESVELHSYSVGNAPTDTSNRIYNVAGILHWNGFPVL